jgi:ankyrin repeat protein
MMVFFSFAITLNANPLVDKLSALAEQIDYGEISTGPEVSEMFYDIINDNKADIHNPDDIGRYPIHIFMEWYAYLMNEYNLGKENEDTKSVNKVFLTIQLLQENGPDINFSNYNSFLPSPLTVLIFSSQSDLNPDILLALDDYGADWSKPSPDPELWYEMGYGAPDDEYKKMVTPVEMILGSDDESYMDNLKELDIKFDEVPEGHVLSPMAYALEKGANGNGKYADVFKKIVDQGGDLNHRVYDGKTSLFELADEELGEYMIDKGMDTEQRCKICNNETLLHRMAWNGNMENARLLIENGANINSKDKDGATPLMWALDYGQVAVAQLLLESGADISIKDKEGNTAQDYGKKLIKKNPELKKYF